MNRRRLGVALMLGGGLLVTFAGSQYVSGAVAQDRARQQWDERVAREAVAAAGAMALTAPAISVIHGEPVARLWIPKIDLDEIVFEGVDDAAMNGGPGHFPGSPLPGAKGNSIISAHRDRHFRRFTGLAVGDTIVTQVGLQKTSWVITARAVLEKDRAILRPSSESVLTLTTCWPIQFFGSAPDRLILTAKPIG